MWYVTKKKACTKVNIEETYKDILIIYVLIEAIGEKIELTDIAQRIGRYKPMTGRSEG